MKFIFVCPKHHQVFESGNFSIVENFGIIIDKDGNKTLDAKVAVDDPCPYCGERHVFHARELACPFSAG